MNDTKLIKEAIKHIDEVLKSNCNAACKQDHLNLKGWLNELLKCRERICKNCKYAEKHENGDEYKCEILMATTQEEAKKLIEVGFGCNRFERR